MTLVTQRPMTLAEFLDFDDGTDTRYELVNGELIAMPAESDLNNAIAIFLLVAFAQFVAARLLRRGTELVTSGVRSTARIPDLMVLTEEAALALAGAKRSILLSDMPPPALIVEVVSPGTANEDRDYRYKRSEYAARGVGEYWLIDPQRGRVTVLTLVAGLYEEATFTAGDRILSSALPQLDLTVMQVLNPMTETLG